MKDLVSLILFVGGIALVKNPNWFHGADTCGRWLVVGVLALALVDGLTTFRQWRER